ncbi:zinc finger protein 644a isoform X2 [Silurus meridionalis]|uniref:zinc finger protein 644a isoform X2 n=1 Tax=Silurus meridionalis TaxID=175797 RepID=UPI001EEA9A1D|nr:zinc finger protein 644a isoform X2 [Silurus meridionalis]
MSAFKESTKKEENDTPMSEFSAPLKSKLAFSLEQSVLEASMQCPDENMTPNGDQVNLLKRVSFIDTDGLAKAAYVNGSASPSASEETLLDISKNVPELLSTHAQNYTNMQTSQVEAHESLRKDGEMSIRQMVKAEDVENRGIWGFDVDSPGNSLDSYDDGDELEWNPQTEFMKFLLEDKDCYETEAAASRGKCKSDKVVMVSPTENLGESSQNAANPESKMHSPISNKSQYSNGTAVAFKHLLQKPAKTRKNGPKPGYVRKRLSGDSEEEPALFPSNSSFKDKSRSQSRTRNCTNQKPFICKECGKDFYNHTSLLKHITVHQTNRRQFVDAVTETDEMINEGKDARLQCPQCAFGTNCPNIFVQHAKTHGKDKRYYPCEKCKFLAASKHELISHMLGKHQVTGVHCTIIRRRDVIQRQKVCKSDKRKTNSVKNRKKDLLFGKLDSENGSRLHSPECKAQEFLEPEDSNGLPQIDKPKSGDTAESKSESKLDKSIHTFISRKKNRNSESRSAPDYDEIVLRAASPDLMNRKCCSDDSLNPDKGSLSPAKCKGKLFALKNSGSGCTFESEGSGQGCKNDCSTGETSSTNHKRAPSEKLKKSPSKRKMSTPFHNLQGQDILIDFPKCRQIFQKNSSLYLINKCNAKDGVLVNNSSFRSSCDLPDQKHGFSQTVSIKEECMETEVCGDTDEPEAILKNGDFMVDLKSCPYCPAVFQSGIALSNHVRGHLHRVGISYKARHVVSAAHVASHDKVPPVRRRIATVSRVKTAKVQRFAQGAKQHGQVSSRLAEEKKRTESNKDPTKGSPSSDLIGILKKRRAHEEAKAKTLQTARKALVVNAVKERDPSAQLPNSVSEKSDLNRKVCVHCNTTFQSGVSLSNHLRAYARRKRNALLEGTTYDCKRKQRSRSGSKKKTYPLLHTPEEIYRLTCRFCDLVFQGPLSVQEDWVKHLQRHIMNTAVPHTGAAMVEVTSFPKDSNTHTHLQTSS